MLNVSYVLAPLLPSEIVRELSNFQINPKRESIDTRTTAICQNILDGIKTFRQTLTKKYDFLYYAGYCPQDDHLLQCRILGGMSQWAQECLQGDVSLECILIMNRRLSRIMAFRFESWWCPFWDRLFVTCLFGGACIHFESRMENPI